DHTGATDGRQQTTVTASGRLGWTDGATAPQINHAHHPEELLQADPDPPNDEVV
ncbi:MAG: HNH nuclease, partial [Mycobacterium sp.]